MQIILIVLYTIEQSLAQINSGNFRNCGKLSVHVSTKDETFCDAWSKCYSMGARLMVEDDFQIIINCTIMSEDVSYFVGLNDLVNERYLNKNGWIFSDGSEIRNINYWSSNEPNNNGGSQDCAVLKVDKLVDISCQKQFQYICVISETNLINANIFKTNSTRPMFNNDDETGCYDEITTRNKLHCATKSITNPYYKSFYFDSNEKLCVLTKYVDSTLPASYNTTNRNWTGFY